MAYGGISSNKRDSVHSSQSEEGKSVGGRP
jgi:hypothetical protein